MKKYVFTLKDDQLHIAFVKKNGKKSKVLATNTYTDLMVSKMVENYSLTPVIKLNQVVDDFLTETKRKGKEAEFILALDKVITRTIEIPYLKKRELKEYLTHHISDYFTVDMNDYYYDYTIVQEQKKSNNSKHLYQLKLVVVPRGVIAGIKQLLSTMHLKMGRISIYPDIMQNLRKKDEAFGVLDTGDQRSILNIYDKGSTFIYASFENQGSHEEFCDEVEYFTDFYASRHEGHPLEKLYVTGHLAEYDSLLEILNQRLTSRVEKVDPLPLKRYGNAEDIIAYPGVILSQIPIKAIRGKSIDFSKETALVEKKERSFKPWQLFILLSLGTVGWFVMYTDYLDHEMALYDGIIADDGTSQNYEVVLQAYEEEKATLTSMSESVDYISSQEIAYLTRLDQVLGLVPSGVSVSTMRLERKGIVLTLSNISDTTLLIDTLIAFNQSGLYEPLAFEQVALNDALDLFVLDLTFVNQGGDALE